MKYLYIIEKADDGSYSAYVPDLPGCVSCGDTVEELRKNITEAIELWIDVTREAGDEVPVPTTTADVTEVIEAA